MHLYLPSKKLDKIRKECKSVRAQGHITVRRLAHLIGLLTSTIPAVLPAPLHYRALQRLKGKALRNSCHNYNTVISLDEEAVKDLDWWTVQASGSNGKPIKLPRAERIIESDASTTGWGASCQGVQTGGPWDQREAQMHINWLELKAAFLALKTFAANWTNLHVLLLLDNRTTIALINKKGSPHSKLLSDLAVQLWEWCLAKGITVRAEHIPGVENVRADRELRRRPDPSDWRMDSKVVMQIFNRWGLLQVDLFAARHNAQLPQYFSFKPDPGAVAVDAFAQDWSNLTPYAFPPFLMVGRCLQKIREEKVEKAVIVSPLWRSQAWYPLLLHMNISNPCLLPQLKDLLTNPQGDQHPLMVLGELTLIAWQVSGNPWRVKEFQRKQSILSVLPGDEGLRNPTLRLGDCGKAGAVRGISILFQHL